MKEQRRTMIESYIAKCSDVTMKELQVLFQISMNTLRADINALVETGTVKKVYGGVKYNKNPEPFISRLEHGRSTKTQISAKAADLIHSGDTIYIDYGTTTMDISEYLGGKTDVTIITPNMHVIQNCMYRKNINLIILPGEYNSLFYGVISDNTIKDLENYYIGKAFMSCCGILLNGGICVSRYSQKRFKEAVMSKSQEKYLLAESSKFEGISPLCYSFISEFDGLVTDFAISEKLMQLCKENNVLVY